MGNSGKEKQNILQYLLNSVGSLKKEQYAFFLSGFAIGTSRIIPSAANCKAVQQIIITLLENVEHRIISQTNCVEIIIQSIFVAMIKQDKTPETLQKMKAFTRTFEESLNELAVNRRYLRDKWQQKSQIRDKSGAVDQASLKLIREMQEEQKRQIEAKRNEEKNNQSIIRKMLEKQNEEHRKKRDQQENKPLQCQICLQQIPIGDVGTLECGHIFHRKCINDHMSACIIDKKIDIGCPSGCGKILPIQDITQFVEEGLKEKYYKFCFDVYVEKNQGGTSWCPTPGCTAVFSYDELDNYKCIICSKHYCLKCRCEYHYGQTCAEYRINHEYSQDDKKFQDFVRGAKFKQCPKCKFWVQRNQGCSTMACRCGHQFCYDCGGSDCPHGQCKFKGAKIPQIRPIRPPVRPPGRPVRRK